MSKKQQDRRRELRNSKALLEIRTYEHWQGTYKKVLFYFIFNSTTATYLLVSYEHCPKNKYH